MCRMVGFVPGDGNSVDFAKIRAFRSLASCGLVCEGSEPGHRDGWGIVTWEGGTPTYLGREPRDATSDPLFEEACAKGEAMKTSSPVIAHLRKASIGLKIKENTHPFVQGEWAFAHNGTIRRLNLKYTTDSQWFFESIMAEAKQNGGDIPSAIAKNVKTVREVYPYTSITCLLSNGKELYAYRDAAANIEFYTIYYANTLEGFAVSQETYFDAPWKLLENGSLLKLREDRTVQITPILPEIQPKAV
jgi:predicted glutamine amidotransferase